MPSPNFTVLYTDIGGVLGTNGWDAPLRRRLCAHFGLDFKEIEARHQLMFDSYERGFLPLDDYLRCVFFSTPRPFTIGDLREYIFNQSTAWPDNIAFFKKVKQTNRLKMGLISNEGQGITEHRVAKFGLRQLADFMVISHCVHLRKPDHEIWRLALNLAQADPAEAIYVDDREMFVNVAAELGFTAVHHISLDSTRLRFRELGLSVE
ncbi:MAG TPA: HAD-IA family hydrolase [Bryobacteraceae bacterium]|jgi:putative hydrolase of the HAD superfamily